MFSLNNRSPKTPVEFTNEQYSDTNLWTMRFVLNYFCD